MSWITEKLKKDTTEAEIRAMPGTRTPSKIWTGC